jgi:UDP-N-acetylmuramoyl-L-alanyl-D-glutamate--2,6-diaminopimelate ligase
MIAFAMHEEGLSAHKAIALGELARALSGERALIEGDSEVQVSGLRQDSRQIEAGDLFAARAGAAVDGAEFARKAVERGAVAVLAELGRELPPLGVPVLRVEDVRRAIAFGAEVLYGYPSRRIPIVGVTGTNGKTTTTFLIERALAELGCRPARLGTLGLALPGVEEAGAFTTPEADEISRLVARAVRAGATEFVMEVSSHALEQVRVAALAFEVAAFTNLTQDHLDFHGTMERYGAAKARLFTELLPKHAVINVDDAFGKTLAKIARGRVTTVSRTGSADIEVRRADIDGSGIRADLRAAGEHVALESQLVGAHNLENLLVALGVLTALGHSPRDAARALGSAAGVPGRLERCDGPDDDLLVVVDYAHTPDALARVLDALRPLTRGKLRCVFGCGGDRDPGKRSKMGAIAAERADFAVVTNDNPRTEEPGAIADAIVSGMSAAKTPYVVELDRARAIELAIGEASPSDTVLIAGKGHEDYQIFGAERRHFDDREVARAALAGRRSAREGRA